MYINLVVMPITGYLQMVSIVAKVPHRITMGKVLEMLTSYLKLMV
jgi:hypothetical protein